MNRFTRDDARRLYVGQAARIALDRALAVKRVAKAVDNATQKTVTDRNVHDRLGALDGVAFLDLTVGTEDHDADVIGLEVKGHPHDATGEFDQLAGLYIVQTVNARNTVTDRQNPTNLGHFGLLTEILDLVLKDRRNLCSLDTHLSDLFH